MKKLINSNSDCPFATRDPYVINYNNMYYRCFTEDAQSVSVACADTIENLSTAEARKVYIPEENKLYSKELWAPELHIIDDKCYIYVACDDGDNYNHRMYVLENNSNDPMKPYKIHGKISDESDKWAIDGTVIEYNGKYYFIWSGWEGDTNICQNLYIAEMNSPFELKSKRVRISTPEYDWEKLGSTGQEGIPYINEGAFAFTYDNKLYLTYSAASSCCEDYCIAMLRLEGDDPLNASAWKKCESPILSSNNSIKGAGHCSVVCKDDDIYVFFHAWDKDEKNVVWSTVSVWYANMKISGDRAVIE